MSSSSLAPIFFGLILGLLLLSSWLTLRKQRRAWSDFARRHGLTPDWHGPRLSGRMEGREVELSTQRRGSSSSRYIVTLLRIAVDDALPQTLSLSREGLGDKLLQLLGREDAELGDAAFDKAFTLNGLSPDATAVLGQPQVRRQLLLLAKAYPDDFRLEEGWLRVGRRGSPSSPEELEAFVKPVLELGQTLASAARRA